MPTPIQSVPTINGVPVGALTSSIISAAGGVVGQLKRVAAQFDKAATTVLTDIPDSVVNLTAGKKYKFRVVLEIAADAVGGYKIGVIGGTCGLSSLIFQINILRNDLSTFTITANAVAPANYGAAGGVSLFVEIEGSMVVSASGTITTQFAQNVAAGTSSVLVGGTFEYTEIP